MSCQLRSLPLAAASYQTWHRPHTRDSSVPVCRTLVSIRLRAGVSFTKWVQARDLCQQLLAFQLEDAKRRPL